MTARKRKPAGSLDGKRASVCVTRGGASIQIDGVPAAEAGLVLADILSAFRLLSRTYPEMKDVPDCVPAGPAIHVPDEYYEEDEGRLGFRVTAEVTPAS